MAISKIQEKKLATMMKMMAIVNDPNAPEGEKQAAQTQIDRMMAKYDLSIEDMRTGDIEPLEFYFEDEKENAYKNAPQWMKSLYSGVFRIYGVLMVGSKDEDGYYYAHLAGRMSDIEIADYVIDVMQKQIRILAKEYAQENGYTMRNANVNGFCQSAVRSALESFQNQYSKAKTTDTVTGREVMVMDQAMVKMDEAEAWFRKHVGDFGTRSARGRYNSDGEAAGKGVSVGAGIASSGRNSK